MAVERRQKRIWMAGGAALLAALAVGLVSGVVIVAGQGRVPLAVIVLACAALTGAALLATIPWWRRLDHMARDAHLTAWYWGASFGGGVALLATIAASGVRAPLFQGAALVFLAQVAAYGVCWLGWWAMRRSKAA
ncbi:hypothetical protein [Caulobacter sp. LjRoot300]|uniref:hypothetical protein n=1 Tax=Caulobacter sp. LjRoot300 TaxID=3342321 RepID=UPI003ECC2DEB